MISKTQIKLYDVFVEHQTKQAKLAFNVEEGTNIERLIKDLNELHEKTMEKWKPLWIELKKEAEEKNKKKENIVP